MKTITIDSQHFPHKQVHVLVKGNVESPRKALFLFHGRGSTASNIMQLSGSLALPDDVVVLAPQADGREWYPQRFLQPRSQNEPNLSSALAVVDALFLYCRETYRIPAEEVVLAGFSQGACVVADYTARKPRRYRGICIFSGGLIGSDEEVHKHEWLGDMQQTPVYIGCDTNDFHIPIDRVKSTADIYQKLHAQTDMRLYEGLGHGIHHEGLQSLSTMLVG